MVKPFSEFEIEVSDVHSLHVEEFGNPQGIPVVYLHGGPGAGCSYREHSLFDLEAFHVVLFDQRGCGKSTPYGELTGQTTQDLIEDIEKIRQAVGVDKWCVTGGSWGSALALYYADAHPDRVERLLLRGLFMADKAGAHNVSEEDGANLLRPDYWDVYAYWDEIKGRPSLIDAYYEVLTSGDEDKMLEAAKRFMIWDNSIAMVDYNGDAIKDAQDNPADQVSISKSWFHFAKNEFVKREASELLSMQDTVGRIPIDLVHGEKDYICPVGNAFQFKDAYPDARIRIIDGAGHSGADQKIANAMIKVTQRWKSELAGRDSLPSFDL